MFIGRADGVAFIGRVPSHRAHGGLFHNILSIEPHQGSYSLRLSYNELASNSDWTIPQGNSSPPLFATTLLPNCGAARLQYFGRSRASSEPEWTDVWPLREWLPDLVRLITVSERGEQEVIVVSLRNEYAERRLAHNLPVDPSIKLGPARHKTLSLGRSR